MKNFCIFLNNNSNSSGNSGLKIKRILKIIIICMALLFLLIGGISFSGMGVGLFELL
jgi:hypothetical protein